MGWCWRRGCITENRYLGSLRQAQRRAPLPCSSDTWGQSMQLLDGELLAGVRRALRDPLQIRWVPEALEPTKIRI